MKNLGLGAKFMMLASFLILVTAGSLIYLSYRTAYQDLEDRIGKKLQTIAATAVLGIKGDLHDTIQDQKDEKSPAFLQLREQLRAVKKANNLSTDLLTFRQIDSGTLKYVVMTNFKPFIGHTYQVKSEMLPTLKQGLPSHTKIFRDQHGAWISAYAAIKNSKGKVVGIIEVDAKLKTFEAKLREKVSLLLLDSVVILFLGLLLSFLLSRGLVSQLRYLRDVTEKISLGQMEHPIDIGSGDEVGQLAKSLERMRESLKVAMEMIADDDDD